LSGERLTPFSYVVLAPIGEGGARPHDLASMMRRGSIHWAAAESQWYGEPKRLERLGLLRSQKAPGKTGPRTHYLLTPKGRDALRAWLAEPSSLPRMQNEAIVRVLDLIQRYGRALLDVHERWLDEAEGELRRSPRKR
jgi:PadR family transcriptional regulator AphA